MTSGFFREVSVGKAANTVTVNGSVIFRDTFENLSAPGTEFSMSILTLTTARSSLTQHPRSNGFIRMYRFCERDALADVEGDTVAYTA